MEKLQLEKLLMRQESLTVLADRAAYLKNKYGENGTTAGAAAEKVQIIRQLVHELPQTTEEIRKNDMDFIAQSDLAGDLSRFIPEYRETRPEAVLQVLTKKGKELSISDQIIMESVINKITSSTSSLDKTKEQMVDNAIKVLTEAGNTRTSKSKNASDAKKQEGRK